ncbi:LEA type 2 family protein [Infirmifilum uzonense]|uniref:LEA type 2 family protein n=1 Tax=Infirmifilum uzonense TaxID=1550241 RepID=UPI003C776290
MAWKAITIIAVVLIASALYLNDLVSSAERISVEVEKISVVSVGLQAANVNLTLAFNNPSNHKYTAEVVNYDVYIEGVKVGNGTITNLEIPPGTTRQSSILTLYYAKLGKALMSLLTQGKIDITVNGTANIKVLFFPVEVKFSRTKTVKP